MVIPAWSDTIRRLYLSGAANQFVLHGNVADRLLVPGDGAPVTGSLTDFLTKEQLRRFDIVIGFELGSGVRVLAGEELFRQVAPAGNPPNTPAQVVGWLDHFLRLCVNLRGLAPANSGSPGPAGKHVSVAIVIGSAELLFPVAKQVRDYELNSMAAVMRSWSHETHFLEQHLAVFLLTEHLNDLNHLLSQNPRAALVEIPLPGEKELVEVFRHFRDRFPKALETFQDRPEVPAARLAGATIGSIETCELILPSCLAAATAFGRPAATSASSKSTCRGRFDISGTSRSMSRRNPTPARASVIATTLPSAPQPTTAIRAAKSFAWPSGPSDAKRVWRE